MRTAKLSPVHATRTANTAPHMITVHTELTKDEGITDVYYFGDWFDASRMLEAMSRAEDTTTEDLTAE